MKTADRSFSVRRPVAGPRARRSVDARAAASTSPHLLDLALWAQPIAHMGDPAHRAVAHELLLRPRTPSRTAPSAAALVTSMERSGVIATVDHWVAVATVDLLGGFDLERAHLNVSGRTIEQDGDHYVEALAGRLAHLGVDPARLTVEITESWPVANVAVIGRFAQAVASAGCRVALDDFGAGAHSLRVLAAVEDVHQVKIDGALIMACSTNDRARRIVASALGIAAAVGAETVVEAVPDDEVARWLTSQGASLAQAFIYGRPSPIGPDGSAGFASRSPVASEV